MKWIARCLVALSALAVSYLPSSPLAAGGSDSLTISASTLSLTGTAPGSFTATLHLYQCRYRVSRFSRRPSLQFPSHAASVIQDMIPRVG